MHNILVTGGAGFIGGCFVRQIIGQTAHHLVNLDKLTYAGNLDSLAEIADNSRYQFVRGDICDRAQVEAAFDRFRPDAAMHLAAESHHERASAKGVQVRRDLAEPAHEALGMLQRGHFVVSTNCKW